ncbi:hypothetical protein Q0Z83_008020 [Actinoplanes sichuanensis]|uniref:Uncharacterized protein n=1 Tax=Actinoplanes sichuanensis TaxID=512349 RepID=A0ABW4AH02_9ACTN|nr:hypothetical protein [Actinoplanes sichuanensis]BEL02611.1 hypothetical protein Q0Z83_008020 [Actinoplanes sichuanensis]
MSTGPVEECVEWFKRCLVRTKGGEPTNIEIRRQYTAEDFGEQLTGEQRAAVARREESADPAYRPFAVQQGAELAARLTPREPEVHGLAAAMIDIDRPA